MNRETETKFHWLIPSTVILRAKFKLSAQTMLSISPSVYQEEIIAWISRLPIEQLHFVSEQNRTVVQEHGLRVTKPSGKILLFFVQAREYKFVKKIYIFFIFSRFFVGTSIGNAFDNETNEM